MKFEIKPSTFKKYLEESKVSVIDYTKPYDVEEEKKKVLTALRSMLLYCTGCGECLSSCYFYHYSPKKAEKIMTEIKEFAFSKKLSKKLSRSTKRFIWTCGICERCNISCPLPKEKQFSRSGLMVMLRAMLVAKQQAPLFIKIARVFLRDIDNPLLKMIWPIATKVLVKDWYNTKNPLYKQIRAKIERAQKLPTKGAEICFFGGCGHTWAAPDVVYQMISILEESGDDFMTIGNPEFCCGMIYSILGFLDLWMDQTNKLLNKYLSLKPRPKKLLLHCPGCTTIHLFDVARYGIDLPLDHLRKMPNGIKMEHISQHTLQLIKERKITPQESVPMTVTYNDNCSIGGRLTLVGEGIFEEPREVLRSIPGVELIESDYVRENAFCCGIMTKTLGFGTNQKELFKHTAYKVNEKLFRNILEKGSDTLITPCMGCEILFEDGARELYKKLGKKIKVMDMNELVNKSLGKDLPKRHGFLNEIIKLKMPFLKPSILKILPRIVKTGAYRDIYKLIKETLIYLLFPKKFKSYKDSKPILK